MRSKAFSSCISSVCGRSFFAMTYSHIAYVDESGDEGFGKIRNQAQGGQSQWLILGALVVRSTADGNLPAWRDAILGRFPEKQSRDLHFRKLSHDQRVVACQELAARDISVCLTLSNKATIPGSRWQEQFKRPGYLYNYLTRWLLERVTTFCAANAAANSIATPRLKVVFSRRANTNYQAMKEYMELMRDGRERIRPVRSINWAVFDPSDIIVENHSLWAGLQLADVATSAFFSAVEPNRFGNVEQRYAETLRSKAIRGPDGIALNVGVSPVPGIDACGAQGEPLTFLRSFRERR